MNKFIYLSWIIGSMLIPLFYMILILVSAFGIITGLLNLMFIIGYGLVWYYIYKTIGNSYVKKRGVR
jgi:hypothetical protein